MSLLRILLVILGPWSAAAFAQESPPDSLSTADLALIARIDAHLNPQRTMQARFVQFNGGGFIEGTVYWRRPDQARFEYDSPSPLLLIASGTLLIEVDLELEQVSHYLQSGSIADYLLADNMLQSPELKILWLDNDNGIIRIRLIEREAPENGDITLLFNANTLDLRRWTISSPNGADIIVSLINPRYNLIVDDDLFHFQRPKEWGPDQQAP
ncbi:MAG: outer membrane lipoprotein carrier protein LolA [Alphaproteobacteria bacterium]|nr:outer membrane lipoprotein carrier protein LolA [Alphaproteobacteria bacterium]